MDWIDLVQWPAMAVTIIAAWLAGSHGRLRRSSGFWLFLASNVLWIAWGWHAGAYALVALQVALAGINIRGARNNTPATENPERPSKGRSGSAVQHAGR